ncbi:hypothetical protein SAMN05421813_10922 [Daejeonella rubra]|uniref:Uncharacterized protein n=1 Tax=Daejeonella rubra TaxID=990371 RepID=A0A1G9S0K1_9SPHI|nr:hypothetical protein SAMN05421813_10922 [Daejeonella rubra]
MKKILILLPKKNSFDSISYGKMDSGLFSVTFS